MSDAGPKRCNVLGVGVHAVELEQAAEMVAAAARERRPLGVACLAVHGATLATRDPELRARLNDLELVVTDGQPIRWALNYLHATGLDERVYGPDLMLACCRKAAESELGVYFYGSSSETLTLLSARLAEQLPELRIAGMQPGRYRAATAAEQRADLARVRESGAAMTFVGLGCPQQEIWVYENRAELRMPVLGVGAAFNYHAGTLPRPPRWMQRRGLEWVFRLTQEPRRLWRRYLLLNPVFVSLLFQQLVGLRRFEISAGSEPPPPVRPS